jgi:putative SOS response-associated peptidase YedK
MCGRYVTPEEAAIERYWHIGRRNWLNYILPVFNVAPTTIVPIIWRNADDELELTAARWGLIPNWWKKDAPPTLTFNARSEEATQKPTWRQGMKSQRCLMPVQGWYEWQELEETDSKGKKRKQPWYIHSADNEVMAFAGLWALWKPVDAEPVRSCALLSKAAAPSIAEVHHRMPVVLKPEHFDEWLDRRTTPQRVQAIIDDARTDFASYPVSTMVNSTRNNSPELLRRVG